MRKLKNWLEGYKEYTNMVQEAPPIFHFWCGLVTIAGAVRRKVWIEHPPDKLYINFYVVLVSPPGKSRKSSAISLGVDFLNNIQGVNISAENITIEAMLRDLANSKDTFMYKGKIIPHSSLIVVSKELSVFLGIKNLKLLAVLCDLFDCHARWTYRTKNVGTDYIDGEWLTMLGATTPDWLCSSLPADAIGGGFTSRVIFVVSESRGKLKPRGKKPKEALEIAEKLMFDLEQIAILHGEFEWSDEAGEYYDDWYMNYKSLTTQWWFVGYFERKPSHIVKIAMVLAISEGDRLVIEKRHLDQAMSLLALTEYEMPRAFGGMGRSPTSQDTFRLMTIIEQREGGISRSELMAMNWMHLSAALFEEVMKTLIGAGKVRHDIKQGEVWYFKK